MDLIFKNASSADQKVIRGITKGATVLEIAHEHDVELLSLCGGAGACGRCKVIVGEGSRCLGLEEDPLPIEKGQVVLACQTFIKEASAVPLTIYIGALSGNT